ncbi:MAG: oligoribonuclease [Bradymonadaceae bacterium]
MPRNDLLVWIDLEMTGLDPKTCVILEIATLITDDDLNIVAEGPELVISQPQELLDGMDEWNTTHHGASGLTEAVRQSMVGNDEAEAQTLSFLRKYIEDGTAPLCGNSIWQDRRFLHEYMPNLANFMHYRNIDVSSFKEMVRRWYPAHFMPPRKPSNHRAMDDIRGSIDELKYYRDKFFVSMPRNM